MKKNVLLVLFSGLCFSAAQSALVLDSGSIVAPTTVITFSGLTGSLVTTPVNLGSGVTMTGTDRGLYFNYNGWGLNNNGQWNKDPDGYVGVNDPGVMTFYFETAVAAVGGFMNYSSLFDCTITALGNSNQVLETYSLSTSGPISTPGGINAGAFRGISRATADIYGYRMSGGYPVLDDLVTSAVPEPVVTPLLGFAVLLMACRRRVRA